MPAETELKEFNRLTRTLMLYKFAYYVRQRSLVEDYEYDILEKYWAVLGRKLRLLDEDETSPCVDFDYKHKDADWAAHAYRRFYE